MPRLKNIAVTLTLCTATFIGGFFFSETKATKLTQALVKQAYEKGKADFQAQDVLKLNHKDLNKVCRVWWFDLTGNERKIEVPPRKVKK